MALVRNLYDETIEGRKFIKIIDSMGLGERVQEILLPLILEADMANPSLWHNAEIINEWIEGLKDNDKVSIGSYMALKKVQEVLAVAANEEAENAEILLVESTSITKSPSTNLRAANIYIKYFTKFYRDERLRQGMHGVAHAWNHASRKIRVFIPESDPNPFFIVMFCARRLFHSSCHLAFDRKKFFAAKKAFKASKDIENATMIEALDCLKLYSFGKDRPATIHVKLQQQESGRPVRGSCTFPHQTSANIDPNSAILVFATGQAATQAKALGANIVGGQELIQDVVDGKLVFTKVLSTLEMFPHVVKIARYLGPKGLMPSPSRGTVSDDIEMMIASLNAAASYEMDSDGYIHLEIARTSWDITRVTDNLRIFVQSLDLIKPPKTKLRKFVERIGMSAEMTPAIALPRNEVLIIEE